ncbi:hypothetical protein DSO57_1017533 [Entomophthora muscae]|uniref:Uncharacterized protein n=1 Tax=Entomophthora muscae TaxID=34485 RepID=A0ACC2U2W8_9FUNG|nr:hypothetical protein DSO57_1017533 [Entomophthora muscae]
MATVNIFSVNMGAVAVATSNDIWKTTVKDFSGSSFLEPVIGLGNTSMSHLLMSLEHQQKAKTRL